LTLWGGRFEGSLSGVSWDFTVDHSDRRLLRHDILGSLAHARMLGATGIIPPADAESIVGGLETILAEVDDGGFGFVETDEDVHTAVERRLVELVGPAGGRLHTGRSRNDQVATDLRLYLRAAGGERAAQIRRLGRVLCDLAGSHASTVVPSYTHLQQAQATTLGEHLLAHAWALTRDLSRLEACVARLNQSPLGASAGAGSSLPLDRRAVAEALGFDGPMENTLDAVGSRDFVAEYVFCCAQAMANLSRLAEEIVLWSTKEFGWATLGDEVSTGSSALPQKRNPDPAELVRGRAAVVAGDVAAILGLQKGLPLAYNRDLQEDKRIVFHADDTLGASLDAMAALLEGVTLAPPPPSPEVAAVDLAEALVTRGVPFREAHEVVGGLVKMVEGSGRRLDEIGEDELVGYDDRFRLDDYSLLDPAASVLRREVPGKVAGQLASLRVILDN
jgi:argininosuccinate lyase